MARVQPSDVKDIIDTFLENSNIQTYINLASTVVEDLSLSANLSEAVLTEIEKWLAAHYIAVSKERQAIKEEAGPVNQWYADVYDKNLMSTSYGQTAAQLDSTGALASIGRRVMKLKSITEVDD